MNKYPKGFTIIELILYITILSILLVGVVQLNLIIKQSDLTFKSQRRTNTDAQTFLNNIDFLVKNASGFAEDDSGPCYDFTGASGPADYYLSLYYDTSTSATVLPDHCVGKGSLTASTTAIKIYWNTTTDPGIYLDCYQGFINQNSGNCSTIQASGDSSFRMTSANNTIVYDGGLSFATSTVGGNTVLETTISIGTPNVDASYHATTTASTTTAFRINIQNDNAPTEEICGDGVVEGSEVCDSVFTSACSEDGTYYAGSYAEDGSTCNGGYACKFDCSACLTELACVGSVCGNGTVEGSEVCDSGQISECSNSAGYYSDSYAEDGATCSGNYACNSTCTACISQVSCVGAVCGNGVKEAGEYCDYSGSACPAPSYRGYRLSPTAPCNGDGACKSDCTACITVDQCVGA